LLLVDQILELVPGRSIRTIKAVTATEHCYAGLTDRATRRHYAYPSSLIVESFGQSAALLWLDGRVPDPADGQVLMFVGATDFRFTGTAEPGDVLRHEVQLDTVIADTAFVHGETWVADRLVASVATLIATRRPVIGTDPTVPGGAAQPRNATASSPSSKGSR
jgi:3-hydroxyacyl-[acyl-carrier-protein] dehydratase